MISPLVLAQACADIYLPDPPQFSNVWNFSGTVAALRKVGDVNVIAFRGSLTATDWIMDIGGALPVWDPRLGFVHGGFLVGVNDVFIAAALIDGPVVLTGHSLGAARARICAGLFAYHGRPAVQCTVFGSPKPAFANLRRILEKSGTVLSSYRNRNDPVPLVPFMGGLYEHPDAWVSLDAAPPAVELDPLRDHHLSLYAQALRAMESAPAAL